MVTEIALTISVSETPEVIKVIEVLSRTLTGMALDGIAGTLEVSNYEIVMGEAADDEEGGGSEDTTA